MLQPKKTKFRRQQKGRQKGNAQRGNQLAFGSFGIKALETKWITGRQIEAARIAVTRYMQRQGQIWIRIFPDKPITRKPADVRMGKGKGCLLYTSEVYKKQSGGRGKFADIIVKIGPVDEDFKEGGLQFIDEVKGGCLLYTSRCV